MSYVTKVYSAVCDNGVLPINPTALRKAKIVCNFGLSECKRAKDVHSKKNGHLMNRISH